MSFIDLLTIPFTVSLSFQKENVNPVEPVKAFDRVSERLELSIKKDFLTPGTSSLKLKRMVESIRTKESN